MRLCVVGVCEDWECVHGWAVGARYTLGMEELDETVRVGLSASACERDTLSLSVSGATERGRDIFGVSLVIRT